MNHEKQELINREDQQLVEKIAKKANEKGYTDTQGLCFILAEDPAYDVDEVMRELKIDTRFFPKQKKQTPFRERVGKWHYVIQKKFSQKKGPSHLHGYSSTEGWLPIDENERSKENTPYEFSGLTDLKNVKYASFKLTDLEKWFTDVLELPFPSRLTPKEAYKNQGKKKHKGPDPKLFDKYVSLAKEFVNREKIRTGQAPSEPELEDHLQALLKKNGETLSIRTKSVLPDAVFKKIWYKIPNRRGVGEKTRPTRK